MIFFFIMNIFNYLFINKSLGQDLAEHQNKHSHLKHKMVRTQKRGDGDFDCDNDNNK